MAVTAAIALAGLGLAVYGAVEKKKAEKRAANNKMPEYKIPQEEYDNLRLAQNYANQGMSAQSMNAYRSMADRGLAIARSGGTVSDIDAAQDKYDQSINNIAIFDDQQRQAHLQTLMAQNARMASYADKRYQLNDYAPWANRAQLFAAQAQGANQTMGQGLGIAAQAGAQFGRSLNSSGNDLPKLETATTPDYGQIPYRSAQNQIGRYGNATSFAASQEDPTAMTDPFGSGGVGYKPYYSVGGQEQPRTYGWNGVMPEQY